MDTLVWGTQREGVSISTEFSVSPRARCIAAQVNRAVLSLLLNTGSSGSAWPRKLKRPSTVPVQSSAHHWSRAC